MMWIIQLLIAQAASLTCVQFLNLLFAALCLAASRGFCPRLTMVLSALLYVGLAVCG